MIPVDDKKISSSTSSAANNSTSSLHDSAILHSLDCNPHDDQQHKNGSDILEDISLTNNDDENLTDDNEIPSSLEVDNNKQVSSFVLIDSQEKLQFVTTDQFTEKLNCKNDTKVKVVSIFGNTGDGKSYSLNNIFFGGRKVFPESTKQESCTIGVRAAYAPGGDNSVICLDTEGLLGYTSRDNQRTRLLLKVLAISDIVIYRTKAERIHKDLFTFLGGASAAYIKHFAKTLNKISDTTGNSENACVSLGPAVIIFHQTQNTQPLLPSAGENSPEALLRKKFNKLGIGLDAFSSIRYIGEQTKTGKTDFQRIKAAINKELVDSRVRFARSPTLVLKALQKLNEQFIERLEDDNTSLIPAEYFSCTTVCASCKERCKLSMGHIKEDLPHSCDKLCVFQHQYQNCQYICTSCLKRGEKEIVVPKMASATDQSSWLGVAKYVWSGYVLECPRCGVIFRSRQYWYGNKEPDQTVVRPEFCHIWETNGIVTTGHNTARRVLDGVTQITEAVASVSTTPSKAFSSWVADQIAPKYWIPNSEILNCHSCKTLFTSDDSKHHCRACGKGFCDVCSSFSRAVPERGWGNSPVRVCKQCFNGHQVNSVSMLDDAAEEIRARKYGEAVISTLSSVASVVIDYPKELIKDSVRPDYWVPDSEIKKCSVCKTDLPTAKQKAHHCRDCGQGVCHSCSMHRIPVPRRGWDTPVRVCDNCHRKKD